MELWEKLFEEREVFHKRMEDYEALPFEERGECYRREIRDAEAKILEITGDPLAGAHRKNIDTQEKADIVDHYLGCRYCTLSKMFALHCSDAEVKRLETMNTRLLQLTQDMFARTSKTYRYLLHAPDGIWKGNTYVEGTLRYQGDSEDDVLRFEEDVFYGSDFTRMILISAYMDEEYNGDLPVISCHPRMLTDASEYKPSMSDRDLGLDNPLDDGTSWAESWLYHPKLNHICMCYATHALVTHNNFSIPDFLRLKTFEVKVEIENWALCGTDDR